MSAPAARGLLAEHTILVTGAASGIGRAAAALFVQEGARVALADRDAAGLARTLDELATLDVSGREVAIARVVDVTEPDEVRACVAAVLAWSGELHGAFNNAGVEGQGGAFVPLADYADDEFDRVQRVNVRGLWNCLRAELPHLLEAGRGSIVNTASVMGAFGSPGMSAYVASKHAVVGLTRAAALEAAAAGVRVNAVLPGPIATPMLLERGFVRNPGFDALAARATPMQRLGRAGEVAEAAAWLLSPRASYVTGHALAVDGGFSAA